MIQGYNLELDEELSELLDQWEEKHPIIPESISQVLVVWNYWECYLNNVKESSNEFFNDGFEFFEEFSKFNLHVFRVEVLDEPLLEYIWEYQKEKYENQAQRFLN